MAQHAKLPLWACQMGGLKTILRYGF